MHNFLFSKKQMQEMTEQVKKEYAQNAKTDKPFLEFAVEVLYNNIKQKPIRYRAFGMYWWALKALFVERGLDFGIARFGQETDDEIAKLFCGGDDEQTVVIAEAFWEDMRATYIEGNQVYPIKHYGQDYILWDSEMEDLF